MTVPHTARVMIAVSLDTRRIRRAGSRRAARVRYRDAAGKEGCEGGAGVGADDAALTVVAEAAADHVVADEQDQDIVHRVDEREHVHGVLCVEQGCCEAHDDHDDGGVHLDSEGGACVFAGVEHAAVEVVDGEGGGAERGDDDELGDDGCCDGVAAAEEYGDGTASTMSATMQKTVATAALRIPWRARR